MFSDAEKRRQYTEVKKKQQNFMAPFYSHFVESTLEPPSGFEHGTPGLEIQHLNHEAIAPWTMVTTIASFRAALFMKDALDRIGNEKSWWLPVS